MREFLAIGLLGLALAACGYSGERDYARAPAETTVVESPGQPTVVYTRPSQGAPLRLCEMNKPC